MDHPTTPTDLLEPKLQLVEEVCDANAGTIFTTARKITLVSVVMLYLLLFFLGLILLTEALGNLCFNSAIYVRLTKPEAIGLLLTGSTLFLLSTYIGFYNQQFVHNLVYRSLVRRAIAEREDISLHHDDPDAVYVKWTPRENWHDVMVDDAKDIGLLLIDDTKRIVIFEGDTYRHTVPFELIVACRTEFGGMFFEPFTLVILDLPEDYTDVPELCYEYRQPRGPLSRWVGKKRAADLKQKIDAALNTSV